MSKRSVSLSRNAILRYLDYLSKKDSSVLDKPLKELGIRPSLCDACIEHGIYTLNDLNKLIVVDAFLYEFDGKSKRATALSRNIESVKDNIDKSKAGNNIKQLTLKKTKQTKKDKQASKKKKTSSAKKPFSLYAIASGKPGKKYTIKEFLEKLAYDNPCVEKQEKA